MGNYMEEDLVLKKIVGYMKAHWPSKVKDEWQVSLAEYPVILKKVLADFTVDKSRGKNFVRVAGLSGSGKTTQILPAVEAYMEEQHLNPVLVAARRFVKYHPHYQEILDFYGEENLRKMTDEFSTIMMFMVLKALMRQGYDIVLDVTLLDPEMEGILLGFLKDYKAMMLMIATSPAVTEHFLASRKWRHTRETEEEFIRATHKALEFYAEKVPEMRIILWSVYDLEPVYDGAVVGCLGVFADYSSRTELPAKDDEARREAKCKYLRTITD